MYENGTGVHKDPVVAYALYGLAAVYPQPWGDAHDDDVKRWNALRSHMTPAQVASANALAAQIAPSGVLLVLDARK